MVRKATATPRKATAKAGKEAAKANGRKATNPELLAKAVAAHLAGMPHGQCLKEFGVSHTAFEFAVLRHQAKAAGWYGSIECTTAAVAAARAQGNSWGRIAVMAGTTEGAVRKAYAGTGVRSQGLRNGKGGRWLAKESALYGTAATHKAGTALAVGAAIPRGKAAVAVAKAQDSLLALSTTELRKAAKAAGVATNGATRAALVVAILKAKAAKA